MRLKDRPELGNSSLPEEKLAGFFAGVGMSFRRSPFFISNVSEEKEHFVARFIRTQEKGSDEGSKSGRHSSSQKNTMGP